MNTGTIIELVGYTGSLLVIISMLMTSITKLRVVNSIGCVIFASYALIIHSYPTAAMQVCLLTINLIGLYNLYKNRKQYTITELKKGDSYINFFIEFQKKDIEKYFPEINLLTGDGISDDKARIYLVSVGTNTAGITLAQKISDDSLQIDLDYTIPAYRDCSVGKYLLQYLKEKGIKKVYAKSDVAEHISYLIKTGFAKENDRFVKVL